MTEVSGHPAGEAPRRKWRRRIGFAGVALLALASLTLWVSAHPRPARTASPKILCANNLKNVGAMLVEWKSTKKPWKRSGAALLLQTYTIGMIRRGEEKVFLCPLDPRPGLLEDPRFLERFQSIDLKAADPALTSYLGRDFDRVPMPETASGKKEPWALCPCHEGGVNVLYDDGSVVWWDRDKLGLASGEAIVVGPASSHELLRMFVAPPK